MITREAWFWGLCAVGIEWVMRERCVSDHIFNPTEPKNGFSVTKADKYNTPSKPDRWTQIRRVLYSVQLNLSLLVVLGKLNNVVQSLVGRNLQIVLVGNMLGHKPTPQEMPG